MSTLFIETGPLYGNPELTDTTSLASEPAPGYPVSTWIEYCLPSFYVGSGDQNLGPHTCVTNTLLTEPSPQVGKIILLYRLLANARKRHLPH